MDEPAKNMTVIQLAVMNNSLWSKLRKGNHVVVTGVLYYWFTGHHHTKVLMAVNKVELVLP